MIVNSKVARKLMASSQLYTNGIRDEAVLAVMEEIPRENFVPESLRRTACVDEDIKLPENRCLIQPLAFAHMLQAAKLRGNEVVLDIGCGTGYSSAVIAELATKVIGIENSTKLVSMARSNLSTIGIDNVSFFKSALEKGYDKERPYDIIFIQGQVDFLPDALFAQLKDGGKIVAIISDDNKNGNPGFVNVVSINNKVISYKKTYQISATSLPEFTSLPKFEF
ncbi:MAG: protein-L-isoaspartate O-methyltransferase [Alphaproteobacteria bacterium CG11_big_fil_rev_8_21_14_0_20_44_7]|nr:MAG: protein-L-isoaspartate O-methyltransferase [Alphaproteobacteria bacterium CG11_big_fil_rev_8_21_14_0_20_44_7]